MASSLRSLIKQAEGGGFSDHQIQLGLTQSKIQNGLGMVALGTNEAALGLQKIGYG